MAPPDDKQLRTTEERLARVSVLQELTVMALDLFDPESPPDLFMERLAERLGCLAAVWVTIAPGARVLLVGAAGVSEASRELPVESPPSGETDPTALSFPFPEVARSGLVRWSFRLHEPAAMATSGSHALLLWFDAARTPPEEYGPAVERLVSVLVTVLTHRRLAQDLRRSYEELARTQLALVDRERLAAIGELAAVIAHEVRNPLAVIFNCIAALEKQAPELGDSKALLAILAEESHRLNQIVSELLEFAKPGAALLESASLEEIVAGAIAAVRAAQPLPVRIELEVAHPLPPQTVDARLIRRAVINLVANAVQATEGAGRVVVRLVEDARDGRPGVRIEVSDDGPGIAPGALERLFEPFFTTKAFGTGLGLPIVKQITEAHRGELTVSSEEGAGTTFAIRLPSSLT